MIQEPNAGVVVILLEWQRKAVCHVHCALVDLSKKHTDDTLLCVLRYAVVMVHDREEHQRVKDDLLGRHGL